MLRSTLPFYFGKHASCYGLHFGCTSVSMLHAMFITAKTVRKLKWWKRIAGAVASRGICHMFISWWCLLAPRFHWDLWKIIDLLQWDLKNACWNHPKNVTFFEGVQHALFKSHCSKTMIFHKSEWKWGAKRHHHDINMWQIPMFSPKRTSPWTWKLMKTLGRFPGRLDMYVHVPGSKIQTWLVNHCCWVNLVCLSISLVNISSKEVSWRKLRVTDCHILTSPEIVVSSWSLKAHVNWAQWSLG